MVQTDLKFGFPFFFKYLLRKSVNIIIDWFNRYNRVCFSSNNETIQSNKVA